MDSRACNDKKISYKLLAMISILSRLIMRSVVAFIPMGFLTPTSLARHALHFSSLLHLDEYATIWGVYLLALCIWLLSTVLFFSYGPV